MMRPTRTPVFRSKRVFSPMSVSIIYTLGYAFWGVDEVEARVTALDARLLDVRHAPHTTKPGFSRPELRERFGERYVHLPGFGNVNYEGGPIELADPETGLATVQEMDGPLVLMCGCQSPEECHRSTVATLLRNRRGGSITHLRPPGREAQGELFS